MQTPRLSPQRCLPGWASAGSTRVHRPHPQFILRCESLTLHFSFPLLRAQPSPLPAASTRAPASPPAAASVAGEAGGSQPCSAWASAGCPAPAGACELINLLPGISRAPVSAQGRRRCAGAVTQSRAELPACLWSGDLSATRRASGAPQQRGHLQQLVEDRFGPAVF